MLSRREASRSKTKLKTSHATPFIVNVSVSVYLAYILSIIAIAHYHKKDRTMPRTYGKRPKQTRLSFNPVGAASPDTQESPGRQAKLRYGHPSMPIVRSERKRLDFKKEEGQKSRKQRPSSPLPMKSLNADEEDEESRPASPQDTKKKRVKPVWKEKKTIAVDEDDELEVAQTKRARNGNQSLKRKRPAVSESGSNKSEQESDADEIVTRPRRKLRRGAASKPNIIHDDDEDEKKDEPESKNQKEEEEEKEEEEHEDEDEDEPLVTPARRRRRNIVSEDPQTPRRGSGQDKIDLEEDLEDLQDSGMS